MGSRVYLQIALMLLDFGWGMLSSRIALWLVFGGNAEVLPEYQFLTVAIPLVFVLKMRDVKAYDVGYCGVLRECLKRTAYWWLRVFVLLAAVLAITGTAHYIVNRWWLIWALIGLLGLWLFRGLLLMAYRAGWLRSISVTRLAIVGAGSEGQELAARIHGSVSREFELIGLFDDRSDPLRDQQASPEQPRLERAGNTGDLLRLIRDNRVDQVLIAIPLRAQERIQAFIHKLRVTPIGIYVNMMPLQSLGLKSGDLRLSTLGEVPLLRVIHSPIGPWAAWLKRLLDIVIASLALIVLAPVMALIALAVRLDSPGPIFFAQRRGGFNTRSFDMYKFRSMRVAAAERMIQARPGDPRATRVGKFLRRWSLDELPQLWNVLVGDISVVGPRPHAVEMDDEYAKILDEYVSRTRVKPGITGWAQINGKRGLTDTPEKMAQRLEYDLYYIEHWSFWLDFLIILKTFGAVIKGDNAY